MREGNIVKAAIPQADGKVKLRPALLLKILPAYDDCLLCGVSSKLHHKVEGFDEIITETDEDYSQSGLLQPSLIRLGFLAAIPQDSIAGSIGKISKDRHLRLLKNLAGFLMNKIEPLRQRSLIS